MSDSIQFDLNTKKLTLKGKEIGSVEYNDGISTVTLNFQFATREQWVGPISAFACALAQLPEYRGTAKEIALQHCTPEDEVEILDNVMRTLNEKTVKGHGYIWRFHKNDLDDFPSTLHGHDYDQCLKVDAITGKIYDINTKNHCETLKENALKDLQNALRSSSDFKDKVEFFIDAPARGLS